MNTTLYRCLQVALLRTHVFPRESVSDTVHSIRFDTEWERQDLVEYIKKLVDDAVFREAIYVASPALAEYANRVVGDDAGLSKLSKLRRLAFALTQYRLRMSSRTTPFGLFAGVAVASFDDDIRADLGCSHQTGSRPSMEWLIRFVHDLEQDPAVLRNVRLIRNDACIFRNGRVILPCASTPSPSSVNHPNQETSIRATRPVLMAYEYAQDWVLFDELVKHLADGLAHAAHDAIVKLLQQMVTTDILLTDIRPPLHSASPLSHVIAATSRGSIRSRQAEVLHEIESTLKVYDDQRLGHGLDLLEKAVHAMMRTGRIDRPVQVDTRLDADVVLPHSVAREAECASEALWRMRPGTSGRPWLRNYTRDFVERYGTDQLVPLHEVLDPIRGIDAPAGYSRPEARRGQSRPDQRWDARRQRIHADLVQTAVSENRREVSIDDDFVTALAGTQDLEAHPPASIELYATLLSPSVGALQKGQFRLVFRPDSGSKSAGASFGRFVHLFNGAEEQLRKIVQSLPTHGNTRRAGLYYWPTTLHAANVGVAANLHDSIITIGSMPVSGEADRISLDDLYVGTTGKILYLVSRDRGCRIVPTATSMLNLYQLAPNLGRFLEELGAGDSEMWRGWDWGMMRYAPFLPRVTYGRSVLTPANWTMRTEMLRRNSFKHWREAFSRWRCRLELPAKVEFSRGDKRLKIDLDDELHLRLVARESEKTDHLTFYELPAGECYEDGWLQGSSGGTHSCELVIPLVNVHTYARQDRVPAEVVRVQNSSTIGHGPGGEWLFAKLYTTPRVQEYLLREELPKALSEWLAEAAVDRWFYIRYHDPEPHLRLRFHSGQEGLWSALLQMLNKWSDALRDRGLVNRLTVDTYFPEYGRYGENAAMCAAERVFMADSALTLRIFIACRDIDDSERLVFAAATGVDLLATFSRAAGLDYLPWLKDQVAGVPELRAVFRQMKSQAVTVIDEENFLEGIGTLVSPSDIEAGVCARRDAVQEYISHLRADTKCSDNLDRMRRIGLSLLHMHHNRLLGIDRQLEAKVAGVAYGAVAERRNRLRYAR